jgi:peroxiredoxin
MRATRHWSAVLILMFLLPVAASAATLKVGDKAPTFTLMDQNWHPVDLSSYLGKKSVVLAFYVLAFTSGWTQELKAYQADIAKFQKTGTQVFGISVDSPAANAAFAKQIGVTFPLLSDMKRQVSREYGILNTKMDFANRTTFVINKRGVITHIDRDKEALSPTGAAAACSLMEHEKAEGKRQ